MHLLFLCIFYLFVCLFIYEHMHVYFIYVFLINAFIIFVHILFVYLLNFLNIFVPSLHSSPLKLLSKLTYLIKCFVNGLI